MILWFGVISHWILDWITHRPDMPLYPGGTTFGLGLWNSIPGTMIVELAMFAGGVWLYARATRPRDGIGRYGFLSLVVILLGLYAGDRFSGPPPNMQTLIWVAILSVPLFILASWWFDRHRQAFASENQEPVPANQFSD